MKLLYLLVIYLSVNTTLIAQNIEFYSGANINRFLDANERYNVYSEYTSEFGFTLGTRFEASPIKKMPMIFDIQLSQYSGSASQAVSGVAGVSGVSFNSTKHVVDIGWYPFLANLFDILDVNVGCRFNYLLHENHNGIASHSHSVIMDRDLSDDDIARAFNFGLASRLNGNIKLNNDWLLKPYYSTYLGLTNEFKIGNGIKSFQHGFGLGIVRNI